MKTERILNLGPRWVCQLHALAALPQTPIGQEAGWALEPVWMLQKREKSVAFTFNSLTYIHPSHYTD
jgi:hypothetical protein